MAVIGKEIEPKGSAEQVAAVEVAGYIERVERQAENKPQPSATTTTSVKSSATQVADAMNMAQSMTQKNQKQEIFLPLDEEGVRNGLHHKVFDAVRWMAEFCVYLIKKYPGKVFYKQPKQ